MEEETYAIALACAVKLLGVIDANPGMPKHALLSHFVYAILAAIEPPVTMRPNAVSFIERHDTPVVIRAYSIRLTKRLRELIQGGFREEEWADVDAEFFRLIQAEFREFHSASRKKIAAQHTHCN
jgi:hypothetical protein